jgi:hypothetical protein
LVWQNVQNLQHEMEPLVGFFSSLNEEQNGVLSSIKGVRSVFCNSKHSVKIVHLVWQNVQNLQHEMEPLVEFFSSLNEEQNGVVLA